MKIFIVKREERRKKYCYPVINKESLWKNENLFCNKYNSLHELPIPYEVDNLIKPTDFPISKNNLVSCDFMTIIKNLNADFEALESKMYYTGKNKKNYIEKSGNIDCSVWQNYYTIILPQYSLLNLDLSIYEKYFNEDLNKYVIVDYSKIVLDKNKLLQLDNLNNFFILEEFESVFLCTEVAKQAIEEAELTGIAFEEVPVE